jgi:hypothetical protein
MADALEVASPPRRAPVQRLPALEQRVRRSAASTRVLRYRERGEVES